MNEFLFVSLLSVVSHSVFSKIRDWKESIKMKMAYEADVGGSCGGDGTAGIKTGRFKHRIRPPLVGSAIFIDGLHKGMQKSDNYVTRLDYRDFSDSDNEQSGIYAPTQLHHSWPSVGERGISDKKVSIREPLLPPLNVTAAASAPAVPNEVSIQSRGWGKINLGLLVGDFFLLFREVNVNASAASDTYGGEDKGCL